ncbi:MAG: hypothetical protein K6A94_12825, partial [Bacteroidales bacterium]|nr:hypothetical protein [Bacteroidales bacterium]
PHSYYIHFLAPVDYQRVASLIQFLGKQWAFGLKGHPAHCQLNLLDQRISCPLTGIISILLPLLIIKQL